MKKLTWDSIFFGFNVAKISSNRPDIIEKHLKELKYSKATLIYVFTKIKLDLKLLNIFNGKLVDTKVYLEKTIKLEKYDEGFLKNVIEFNKNFSKERLYELAFLSGKHSRYNLDKKIGRDKFEELYRLWVDNSISKKFASKIYIYVENNKIIGFITLKKDIEFGMIGLIAVDNHYQGKGIGKKLLLKAELYLFNNNIKSLRVPTQEMNKLALDFYYKNKFQIIKSYLIYHFWNN